MSLYVPCYRPYNKHNTDIHAPGGIKTHDPSKRAAEDPRLRPHGHSDRLHLLICLLNLWSLSNSVISVSLCLIHSVPFFRYTSLNHFLTLISISHKLYFTIFNSHLLHNSPLSPIFHVSLCRCRCVVSIVSVQSFKSSVMLHCVTGQATTTTQRKIPEHLARNQHRC
jgi:hypothetical protein